jgi:Zn-dependent protease with chaperone function
VIQNKHFTKMKTLQQLLVAVVFLLGATASAQQTPAAAQAAAFTITGATAHIGNGK